MRHHVIYLPGLGDDKPFQRVLLGWWWVLGIRVHYHHIGWDDGHETFDDKLQGVLNQIDEIATPDRAISLIGTSAGASMALNAYSVRKEHIRRIVLVCGKIQRIETVSEDYYHKNPAFRGSLALLSTSLRGLTSQDKEKMLIVQPVQDDVVTVEDMLIPEVATMRMATRGHAKSIAAAFTIYARRLVRFLKS